MKSLMLNPIAWHTIPIAFFRFIVLSTKGRSLFDQLSTAGTLVFSLCSDLRGDLVLNHDIGVIKGSVSTLGKMQKQQHP